MQFKTSVIIPTYNRPVDLKNCIESILNQTQLPYEIIIVDDGNLPEPPLKTQSEELGIKYVYYKKDNPGLTASRNKGIELSTGDIVFFFDDDVVLFPDYIEKILNIYNTVENVGAVGGAIANLKKLGLSDKLQWLFRTYFMCYGFREGRVLPSGFCTDYGKTPFGVKKVKQVDFLQGCAMSFKKEVFSRLAFDSENFLNYGMGEDKDFSYRVSKAYKVIFTPYAKLYHYESLPMRPNNYRITYMFVNFIYYFFKTHVKRSPVQWLFFYYALLGYLMSRVLALALSPKKQNVDKIKGVLGAFYEVIFRGK